MLKVIGQWGVVVVSAMLLIACGGGTGNSDSNTGDPGQSDTASADFSIVHFSSRIGESVLDYSLIPAAETVVYTADLDSENIQVQLQYADKAEKLTPIAVSIENQTVTFKSPGNVLEGRLSLLEGNTSSSAFDYRVIEENTPRLIDAEPVSVNPGDQVTVTGVNLPEIPLKLIFGLQQSTVSIDVTPVNDTITFTVPSNLATSEFYLQLAQFQTNKLYISVNRNINANIALPTNLASEVGDVSVVTGGEEYLPNSNLEISFPVENNAPEIIHVFAEKGDASVVLYSSVVLPEVSGPVTFDAKSTAIAWTIMGLLTTSNLSHADYANLYAQLQSNKKIQLLADHITSLQEQNSGHWLDLNDTVLLQKFRDVAEDLAQRAAARAPAGTAQKITVSNSYLTISQEPESNVIYVNDNNYSLDLVATSHLANGNVSIVNDTQMYLSVEARSVQDNSIINGYQHNNDVFYSEAKSLIGPKHGWTISNSEEIELQGDDTRLEIITAGILGVSDKTELSLNLKAKVIVDGILLPMTNSLLNLLIDKRFPEGSNSKLLYGTLNSIYGSGFLKDLKLYIDRPDYSLYGIGTTFFVNPVVNSITACMTAREGCLVIANAIAGAGGYGYLGSIHSTDELVAALILGIENKLLLHAVSLASGVGAIFEAFKNGETLVYAIADGVTIAESLWDISKNPKEINVDIEFALDIENVSSTCIGVDAQDNYNFVLDIEGEGFMAVDSQVPSVYLGIGYAETQLASVSAFNNGTLLSAVDDPNKFITEGSDSYYLYVGYSPSFSVQYKDLIQFIDINDEVVYLESIEPAKGNIGNEISLKGCGWIPLDDINVHFKSDNGEVLASDIVSRSIDEIKVKVPDEAVTGMVYVTAGNKTTSKEFFEIKTFSLKPPESPSVLPGEELSLGGKGLDETSAVYFTDHSGNSINATLGGITDNSIIVTVPEGLIPGVITVYAERPDGKMTNEIELVIIPSLVTATPDDTAFEDTIQLTLSQAENFAIYYRIEEAPYAIYTGPITLNASETEYAYFSIYAFARIEVDGVNYDSAETEFRYTPCQQGEHVENGACVGVAPPVSGSQSCPLTYDLSVDPDGDHAFMIYTSDKDKDGFFEDYTHCIYFNSTGHLTLESFYIDTVKHGLQTIYYDSGIVRYEEPFENGLLNGVRKTYYESGKLEFETEYLNGKKHGQEKEYYYANKTVVYCSLYENGVYVGSCGSTSY